MIKKSASIKPKLNQDSTGRNGKIKNKNEQEREQEREPKGFKKITKNIYFSRPEHKPKPHDIQICSCNISTQCDTSKCINSLICIECSPSHCKFAECQNQRFQKVQYASFIPKFSGEKGWGLFAEGPISKGQFIIEYVGEVINNEELEIRSKEYASDPHFYFLTLDGGETIDASRKGNWARLINHSCSPNSITQKWHVLGEIKIGIFALKKIKVGEEITFDYKFERFGMEKQKCLCGSVNCCKFLGSKPPSKKKKLKNEQVIATSKIEPTQAQIDLLLEDQPLKEFPFIINDRNCYYLKENEIPSETDSEFFSDEDESKNSQFDQKNYHKHPCREFVNRFKNGSPIFLRSQAHRNKIKQLKYYQKTLYTSIYKLSQKKKENHLFLGNQQKWVESLDIQKLIKEGKLQFEPISIEEKAIQRKLSMRTMKK